jgi:hypothetical protein
MMELRHWNVPVYLGLPAPASMLCVWMRTLTVSSGYPTRMPADPGVNVMIVIFGNFHQFSAKKIGGFHENQCTYTNGFILSQTFQLFQPIQLGENISKIITLILGQKGIPCERQITKSPLNFDTLISNPARQIK